MEKNFGKLLDNLDQERWASGHGKDLFQASPDTLREIYFGGVINKMFKKSTTLLTGHTFDLPNNMAPFLYFHNSIAIEVCPFCPMAENPNLLKPYLDRKLIVVFATAHFENYNPEFQKLAYTYPEFFVGRSSYFIFKQYSLNDHPTHKPVSEGGECTHCTAVDKINSTIKTLPDSDSNKNYLSNIGSYISGIPTNDVVSATELFLDTIDNPTEESIRELDTTINLMYYLSSTKSLNAIPQLDSKFLDSSELFLNPLRISHNQEMNSEDYLDLVMDFKGTLSLEILPKDKDALLPQVLKINEEVDKIQTSNRLPLSDFLSNLVMAIPSVLARIATQGTYGAEGTYQQPLKNFKSGRLSEIKTKILSNYYGVSEIGIQVWNIKRKLEQQKNI